MKYQKVTIQIEPFNNQMVEILIAWLSEMGYEGFQEIDEGLEAYVPLHLFSPLSADNLPALANPGFRFQISSQRLEEKNWNEEWEKNYFKPIVIADKCLIRSPFQQPPASCEYEILVEPRMAFGTGHHETTSLMLQHLMEANLKNLRILDMGCGTGILGILGSMKGAREVVGIDNDHWAVENARDNLIINGIKNMTIEQGDADTLKKLPPFNTILANINRNILLNDMKHYNQVLVPGGIIYLSGFYTEDLQKIDQEAKRLSWNTVLTKKHNNWMAIAYSKAIE